MRQERDEQLDPETRPDCQQVVPGVETSNVSVCRAPQPPLLRRVERTWHRINDRQQ